MTYQEGLNKAAEASQKIIESNQLTNESVMNAFLFTWQWWIAVTMIVVPWIVWWVVRDRENSARIFSAGLLVMVLSEIHDAIGVSFGWWAYPVKVIPVATVSFSFRLSVIPVLVMLLLQFKPHFNPFIKAIAFGGLGAYVGLPLLDFIDLHKTINWSLTYSFIILTIMYLLAHWFSRRNSFKEVDKNEKLKQ